MRKGPLLTLAPEKPPYDQCVTLIDILRWRAQHQPDRSAYTFLPDGENAEVSITYAQLEREARAIAMTLQRQADMGARALLLYQSGLEYVAAFLGCLYAGIIAVPAYPPSSRRSLTRIQSIAQDAQATLILTNSQMISKIQQWSELLPTLEDMCWIASDRCQSEQDQGVSWQPPVLTSDMLTFLQYTSGSTGTPKGVMVSHGNLMHNSAMMCERWQHSPQSVGVSWLPMFHDMGLIAGVLQPLYVGFPAILMPPVAFIQRPLRWLQAISRYQGTTTCAPNFAYELCIRRIAAEERLPLDLNSWSVAVNGAEPVNPRTIDHFVEVFEPYGFRRAAVCPGYGLAEGTLMVASGSVDKVPTIFHLSKTQLAQRRSMLLSEPDETAQSFVGCGPTASDQRVVIVHPETLQRCSPDELGEIWVAGPSVTQGYWQRPQETADTFQAYIAETGEGPFLRTGDLGFFHNGEVCVAGRLKDIIIIRGRNYYPQDIELLVEQCHTSLRPGCGAAFSVVVANEERLVVVQEVVRGYEEADAPLIFSAIRQAIAEEYEIQPYAIVLIKYGSISKTSSGKIQRRACREAFLTGDLSMVTSDILEEALSSRQELQEHLTRDMMLNMEPLERHSLLCSYLQTCISVLLGTKPARLSNHTAMSSLGLDSLKAAELKYILEDDLKITIAFTDFLQDRTIDDLARHILNLVDESAVLPIPFPSIPSGKEDYGEYPLSYLQEPLWVLHQLEPDSSVYNIPLFLYINGKLDRALLVESMRRIVSRHDTLRTTIQVRGGQFVQHVTSSCLPVSMLSIVDLQGLSFSDTRVVEARKQAQHMANQPFNLSHDTLLRARLVCLAREEHILLLTMHHIISDGWSIGLLIQELAFFYNGLLTGKDPYLPPLAVQYAEYALWQREWLSGEVLTKQLAYWKQQLADLTVLDFPTDRPRPSVQSFRGATQQFVISTQWKERFKELSSQEGVTLFMAFFAVFQILLMLYTGQQDIVVGTTVANRPKAELKGQIGFFVNTLLLRTKFSNVSSFRELLKQVRQICLDAYAHQDIPFPQIVAELSPERDLSRNPLFQVTFAWQPDVLEGLTLAGLDVQQFNTESTTARFDLSFDIFEGKNLLNGIVEYNVDLFDATTIERFIGHFQFLLEQIAINPDQNFTQLALLTTEERQCILETWNSTDVDFPRAMCLHHIFEAQVDRIPDKVAVIFEDAMLTYREINRQANQLAHHLQALGVGPEVAVGLCVERSPKMLIGVLGVLKAGGAYIPLDPAYPAERLTFMLQNSQTPVLLTQANLMTNVPFQPAHTVYLDTDCSDIQKQATENPASAVQPENIAYVIYTSGSTGQPKGVLGTHQAFMNRLNWMWRTYPFQADDMCCQKTALSFVDSLWEIFGPLLQGICSVIIPNELVQDVPRFMHTLNVYQISRLVLVPSLLRSVLENSTMVQENLSCLKYIVTSGEFLPFELWQQFQERLPQSTLLNLYGSSEIAADATWFDTDKDSVSASVPIGHPISNMRIYLLNAYLQPQPVGIAGELYASGANMARGYLHRPDLTAERFIPHPFSHQPGARLYRTGDTARYRPDGNIEFLGRADDQIKIRGHRIEPGEIEAALKQHPAVHQCAVVAHAKNPGDQRLVAYIIVKPAQSAPSGTLFRSFLQAILPGYMLPSYFEILEAFPLTPSGKVNRKALSLRTVSLKEVQSEFVRVLPRTPVEELLAELWCEILDCSQVGVHDDFFALGGHSLLATQLIARVQVVFQVDLPVRTLFEAATVAKLAQRIEDARSNGDQDRSALPITSVGVKEAPLSFAQQRLWFLSHLEPESAAYILANAKSMHGKLDVMALQRSLQLLLQRHEGLRTIFLEKEGQPIQRVRPFVAADGLSPIVDLQGLVPRERETEATRIVQQEVNRPCDLTRGPLLRPWLLRIDKHEHVLLLTLHHIITDGWSNEILYRELAHFYRACIDDKPAMLPPLPIQYADFALWQHRWLRGKIFDVQLAYWRQKLTGTPPLELPTDYPRPNAQTYRGALQAISLPEALCDGMVALSQQEGVSLFMLLLAAFQTVLARYTGQYDISIGVPIANRTRPELEGLIGFFVNTLVLRSQLSGRQTFKEALREVREVALEAYSHQDIPFERLVEEMQPERDLSRSPLFQVMFSMQYEAAQPLQMGALDLREFAIEHTTAKFDLTLFVIKSSQGLRCGIEYSTDLFADNTISRLFGHWQVLLQGIVDTPSMPLASLPLLTKGERETLLYTWNETRTPVPQDVGLHNLIEVQAASTPEAVAVIFENMVLTYRALNILANRLARHLRTLGVDQNAPVGLCMERSLEMIIGQVAILKAGGAYVPLDPAYPAERLRFILQETQVPVLLTQHNLLQLLPPCQTQVQDVKMLLSQLQSLPKEEDHAGLSQQMFFQEQLAYILYTSGSTGEPKGVGITHRSAVTFAQWAKNTFSAQLLSGVLASTSICFDLSIFELFVPLCWGGAVVLVENALQICEVPDAGRITLINTVPSVAAELVRTGTVPSSVRVINLAGEPLQRSLVQQLYQLSHIEQVVNLYGPTEDTTYSIWTVLANQAEASVPIGRPLANTQIYVLDALLQPVPQGFPGELYLAGKGLARGYFQRPDLTAERFLPHALGHEMGARLYKTGDLVRYRSDGILEYLGRIDQQVKIRGFRIELGEIEAVLRKHELVRECVVQVREDIPGMKRLVAYVVSQHSSHLQIEELRGALQQQLPAYMLPAAFIQLEVLPLTANGKIDRQALPAPDESTVQGRQEVVMPRTEVERTLATIWCEVLRRQQISIYDNFFALGGDSILTLQVASRARLAGIHITPKLLFQYQTIAELVSVIEPGQSQETFVVEQAPVSGDVPLTPIQRWFFSQHFLTPHHFNQALLLSVRRPLDINSLELAFKYMFTQHDALRLHFFNQGEQGWRQVYAANELSFSITMLSLTGLTAEEANCTIERHATLLQASLDLHVAPLMRACLFDRGGQHPLQLLIVFHHLIIDGVSWRILLEDMQTAYAQLQQGQAVQLPPKTSSYQYWAQRLAAYAQQLELKAELAYWLSTLARDTFSLPTDKAMGENVVSSTRTIHCALGEIETSRLLTQASHAYHTQINDLLLAALAFALANWTGRDTILFDLEGHGRENLFEEADLSRTVGWFTMIYPVLLDLSEPGPRREVADLIKSVKEQLRASSRHGMSYGLLRYLCEDKTIADQIQALAQPEVVFNYLGQLDQIFAPEALFALDADACGAAIGPSEKRPHVLEINGGILAGCLQVKWTFSQNIHDEATIVALAQDYLQILQTLIAHCCARSVESFTPSDFPLAQLSQRQLDTLLAQHPPVEDMYPLSPLQEGLLFHTLQHPNMGMYVTQMAWSFKGTLDVARFERAWQVAIAQYNALRTCFAWDDDQRFLQVVQRSCQIPLSVLDWRGLSSQEQRQQQEVLLRADRVQGFALHKAPLMRLTIAYEAIDRVFVLWSHHHLILDGWSMLVLLRDVLRFYEQFCLEKELTVIQSRPYRDYIVWLQNQDRERAEQFWRRHLERVSNPTRLAVDHRASSSADMLPGRVVEEALVLEQDVTAQVQTCARNHHVTMNTLLQGTWAVIMSRYSGERDVVFGSVDAGRYPTLPGSEAMIGLFINTLPVYIQVEPGANIWEWFQDLQTQQIEARQYGYVPLVKIHELSGLSRGQALFDSILVFENYPVDTSAMATLPDLQIENIHTLEQTHYALTIQISLRGDELHFTAIYDAARFQEETIRSLLSYWQRLLTSLVRDQHHTLAELPLLAQAEQHKLLVQWNRTEKIALLKERCLHTLIEEQVLRTPDAIALTYEDEFLTYDSLNTRANQLAHYLRALGVGPEVVVGVFMERSLLLSISLLGILKAGGAYLPLDLSYPQERLAFMLSMSHVTVLLTAATFTQYVEMLASSYPLINAASPATLTTPYSEIDTHCTVVYLDTAWSNSPAQPSVNQPCPIDKQRKDNPLLLTTPGNLAYVIYTSGSTGEPKGAMNTHQGICNRLLWMQETYQLTDADRVLQKTPISFDVSVWELFWPLLTGAQLIFARPGGHRDSAYLVHTLIERQITTLHFVPSMLQVFLEEEGVENCVDVKRVICSGEALSFSLQERFFKLLHAELHNLYGPTEAAIDVTFWACTPQSKYSFVPIGRPISNTFLYILDKYMQPVPIDVPGELYIGGSGLARGYSQQPALTAERFVPNPFVETNEALPQTGALWTRLYRTGDRVRYLADGTIEYLDRIDYQIKLRGFRIELGEIEAVLNAHAAIRESVVLARTDLVEGVCLVAYIVGALAEDPPSVGALRGYLHEKLPDYMVPSFFITLPALPLTLNGKADRRTLAQLPLETKEPVASSLPQTAVEQQIAALWQKILLRTEVGIDDNFFDLGGHSLHLPRLQKELQKHFNRDVSMTDLFQYTTIRTLAGFINLEQEENAITVPDDDHVQRRRNSTKRQRSLRQQHMTEISWNGVIDE